MNSVAGAYEVPRGEPRPLGVFVDGRFRPSAAGKTVAVENPKNGDLVAEVAEGDRADIDGAARVAVRASETCVQTRRAGRADILHHAAAVLRSRLPDIVTWEVDQTGWPQWEMAAQLARPPEWYAYFGAVARAHEGTVPPCGGERLDYTRWVPQRHT